MPESAIHISLIWFESIYVLVYINRLDVVCLNLYLLLSLCIDAQTCVYTKMKNKTVLDPLKSIFNLGRNVVFLITEAKNGTSCIYLYL